MKTRYMLSMMSLVCLTILTACGGSEPAAVSQQSSPPQPEAAQAPQTPAAPAETFIAGQLQEIDPDAMTFVLKDVQGAEQQFAFSSDTKITGIPRAGDLRNQEGRSATIRYVDRDNRKSAVQIHIEVGS